ncbi:MAG TPA: outer membrane protein assembly factor BamB family protein [Candidatus Wunengus sp. YC61]|uniref:outer membrane protein assembly factor BamB family protein n=1 Tax=Candidatus Wunengus sp. YC61 TaxID=3367698 RepID=UPI004025F37D
MINFKIFQNLLFILAAFTMKYVSFKNFYRSFLRNFCLAWLFTNLFFMVSYSSVFAQLADSSWPMFMHDIKHTGQSTLNGPQKNTLYWQYKTGSEIVAPPVLSTDGTIYVGDTSGKFHAINQDGTKKWTYATGDEISAATAIDASGVIYIGSDDKYLYAINNDGSLKWQYKTLGSISSSPVINPKDGAIYFGSEDKKLYALDISGKLKWKAALDEQIWSSPALDTGYNVIYVGTLAGTLYALNTDDGTEKWTYETEDIIIGSPSIDTTNGFIIFGSGNGKVYALNRKDGSRKWIYTASEGISSTASIDTATDANAVYVGAEDGNLYSLSRTTGSLNWKYTTGNAITSSPAIGKNGSIYFGSADNNIYSVSKNGALQWTYTTKDEVNSSPAIGSNELLYIGSSDGYLYAIGAESTTTLTAGFSATPTSGEAPLTVKFTDESVGNVSSWQWDFGDGNTSTEQNPSHTYNSSGSFTIILTVTDASGSTDTETKDNYISITRKASTIELTLSDSEIIFGESLSITGQISPAHQAQATLTFTNDEGETETETVTSNSSGIFVLTDYFPTDGGSWSVVVSWEGGSDHSDAESSPLTFMVNPAEITLTAEPFSSTIQINQTVNVSGIVTLTPDNETTRNEFLEENLKLISIDPDGEYEDVIETQPFLSSDQIQYKFEAVKLPDVGAWKLLVGFEEDNSFTGTNSATIEIEVHEVAKEVAGYAILVEGRVKEKSADDKAKARVKDSSDLDSHNLTTNDIYEKLLKRGFTEDNIYYFNFDDSQDGVYGKPAKDEIINTITEMASFMNESPAPLYLIFAGFGDKEKFFMYPDTLKSSDLADALNSLESQLNATASEEPLVIVLGANRSGSFINALSKSGSKRVIITSADTEEVAYKGPLPPDETIRHADYFVWEFFKYAAGGLSLKKCYEKAADKIAEFTENEDGNGLKGASAGNGQYFDDSAQHPLLDDNGDGVGTYGILSSLSGKDGEISSDLVLGIGTTTTPLELTEVTDVITLEAENGSPALFAKVNDTTKVDEAWTEIVSPNFSLKNDKDATEQQVINLPRFKYNEFDSTEEKYIWNDFSSNKNFNDFGKTGEYEIFYFARDNFGRITPFMESVVYKNAADNQPPESFNPISPGNGTETAVALTFDWEDSTDPDSKTALPDDGTNAKTASKTEGVTYTLMVSESSDFGTIKYQQKGLADSTAIVDKTAGLIDGTTYYWKVLASDAKGGTTLTGTSTSFKPKLSNGYPGFIKGFIFDKDTNAKISNATISVQGTKGSYTTTKSGAYFLQLSSGTYPLSVEASGYETGTQTVTVNALNTTAQNIGLTVATQKSSIFGTIKDKKSKPLEGVTITVKKRSFIETATTDSSGSYSFNDLESGKYLLTAKKSGYSSYKKNIKLSAGQDKKLNIKLKKKK